MTEDTPGRMNRRQFLAATGVTSLAATAGCLSSFTSTGPQAPPTVTDRPDAVYVPSHVEGMKMAGMRSAGDYQLAVSYSFPHRFWLVNGTKTNVVKIKESDSVHLMASVWDKATGTIVPVGNIRMTVSKDGEELTSRRMWPMLSQNMGFHAGDNVGLDGDGKYKIDVSIDPVGMRRTGAFQGKFGEQQETSVVFEFSNQTLNDEVMFKRLEEKQGSKGAVPKMEMEMMPIASTPTRSEMPGSNVGIGRSGDAKFVVNVLDSPPEGVSGDGSYLVVSPRTPYHGYPLPLMSLSATVKRDGSTPFDGGLNGTVDPELGIHYGAVVDSLQSGDEITIAPGVPPQVARHEGYETAFLQMDEISMTVT